MTTDRRIRLAYLIGTLITVLGTAQDSHKFDLEVGAAPVRITPAIGTPMAGYYYERGAEGVHDDLFANALVLRQGETTAALVSLDLISTRKVFVDEARSRIEAQTGIPGGNIMISATHAHTGPIFGKASSRYDAHGGKNPLAIRYTLELPAKIAEAVQLAHDRLQSSAVHAAIGKEPSITFNRRFHMKDGSVGWNPGKQNPNILKPAGPIDDQVPIVRFSSGDDAPVAVYVNYSVHLDNVGGQNFSADLPYWLATRLNDAIPGEFLTVYTSGACGDLNHIDVTTGMPQKGHENAARMGTILAAEVLRQWPHMESVTGSPLQIARQSVSLPVPRATDEELIAAEETIKRLAARQRNRDEFLQVVHAFKLIDLAERDFAPFDVEVQVITLGKDLAWVALPGEIFVELGLDIKMDSPFKKTMVVELANGSIGYIPNRRAYPQGNYEVVSARVAEGAGEILTRTADRLLKELYAEALAEADEYGGPTQQ